MIQRDFEASVRLVIPAHPFELPSRPFGLHFARKNVAVPQDLTCDKGTKTDADTTGGDGSTPNPNSNEVLDWMDDD
uniref:Uncharacterized protein n=1 Tax=Thermosporothrix sp. COM3 TaxID=2490863 RepID=A0A455SE58_9CHLR|nr:hypothetical protein KTC_00030 [Thermosporothrix sp. COM3]